MRRLIQRRTWLAGAAVFAVTLAALAVAHSRSAPTYSLSHPAAVRAALANADVRAHLRRHPYTRARVTPLDGSQQRVSFLDGPRLVLDAAVADDGSVPHVAPRFPGRAPSGAPAAFSPLVWLLLLAGLVVALAAARLRSLRTLDVLALAAFCAPIACYRAGLVAATVSTSLPPLVYLGARCAAVALGPPATPTSHPVLYEALTARLDPARRLRLLGLLTAAAAVILVMVTVTSNQMSDVAYASMAGATLLAHGVLPYGHMPPDVVHGDTYPLLNYVAHVPAAVLMPVRDGFDDTTGALLTAAAAALAAAAGIGVAAARATGSTRSGVRMALGFLAFPPVLIAASGGTNDLLLAACLAWALALAARPGRGSLALAAAAWVKLLPLALVPIWLARLRGRALARGLAAVVAVSGAVGVATLALGGPGGVADTASALSFQFARGSLFSIWGQLGAAPAQLVVQAALLSFVALATLRLRRDPDPRRLAAAAGAVLIGFQLAANYWTYAYLPWLFPCLALALLIDRPPGEAQSTTVSSLDSELKTSWPPSVTATRSSIRTP